MKIKLFISLLIVILISQADLKSQCFPEGCFLTRAASKEYTVDHKRCGNCTYTVFFRECIQNGNSVILIDSIVASPSNPECCQGTAINDPIVSGYILEEAAKQAAESGVGITRSVYTPSKCYKWVGTLGPVPIHRAVLVPCDIGISCCEFTYNSSGQLIERNSYGSNYCDYDQACFKICD